MALRAFSSIVYDRSSSCRMHQQQLRSSIAGGTRVFSVRFRSVCQLQRPRRAFRAAASKDESGGAHEHDMPKAELDLALQEALDIFNQANTMSSLQVQAELQQAFEAEEDPSSGSNALQEMGNTQPDALLHFWIEQGLSTAASGLLVQEIQASGRHYTTSQLSSKVARLQRVLPGTDVATLAAKDCAVLDADINMALSNMICLVEAFPGKDIMSFLVRQPRLMWATDMRDRVQRVFNKLVELHPSGDVAVVRDIIAENPELLFRMDYYMHATTLDYLPIEIQNMMVLTGQGLSFLYRYYNNKRTDYQAEIYRHNFPLPERDAN